MSNPFLLRLRDDEGKERTYRATIKNLGRDGLLCSAELPPVAPGAEVIASLKVPEWFIVPRRLDLPAVIEHHGEREWGLQFKPFDQGIAQRFEAYLRKALSAHEKLRASQGAESLLAEAFRMIQVNLELLEGGQTRVVLVTSSVSGEGKTFIATGLAVLLAHEGRRVLLVDADLYRPALHEAFGLVPLSGVARLLSEKPRVELGRLMQEARPGLSVLTAGSMGIPSELYAPSMVAALLDVLRGADFDVVIMDSPPLLEAAGALPLARAADDVLLAVRSGRSRERDVRQTRVLLERNGVRPRGVILNDYPGLVQRSYSDGSAPRRTAVRGAGAMQADEKTHIDHRRLTGRKDRLHRDR
jgi:capsular exopolysaccharide synthesis family protein